MKNIDSYNHLSGTSVYLDDLPLLEGTLFGAVYDSPAAHGRIRKLDLGEALQVDGVVRIFTHADIPGENEVGGIVRDEPLLAKDTVHFCGMPVAFVVACTEEAARTAVKKIRMEIDPLPVITDPREAKEKGALIIPPRTFSLGDTAAAWSQCAHVFEGRADSNGQEHLYIETQGAYSIPGEDGSIRICSSTQGPTAVQRHASNILGLPMHRIEVDVTRLGGGFGGKEDQATHWAVLCALATHHLNRPVKLSMHRIDDMRMTGKRHPYSSDFRIGLSEDLRILAYEVSFYQNAGATADLSPAVMERTLFHCTNSYFIPNVKATAYSCRTNLPSNTAFRGFGGPQGMFVIESAIALAAEKLGIAAFRIQEKNLIQSGESFPYGQLAQSEAQSCWQKMQELHNIRKKRSEIESFNQNNTLHKKGMALMPVCFGISFTKILMNQGRSLVHVYTDGSVGISTGAVEMGQGVNTKILQVAAGVFSIDAAQIKVQSTSTLRIANTSPSAASATADLNGRATEMACQEILSRLKTAAAEELGVAEDSIEISNGLVRSAGKETGWDWKRLVMAAYVKRINLSAHAHYATPEIFFDNTKEKGHPFAYHVYGTALVSVTIDCLRGCYDVDEVNIVHDIGCGMSPLIDRGQIEGGVVQGIGWMTMEELVYDAEGRLRSNALSTYKVPDVYAAPKNITLHFLKTESGQLAVFRSKAVGEPPLMYGIGAYFALRDAIRAFRPGASPAFDAPMTPEKVLMNLYQPVTVSAPVS